MLNNLSFGLGDATTNGSALGSWATGVADTSFNTPSGTGTTGAGTTPGVAVAPPTTPGAPPAQQGGGMGLWGEGGKIGTVIGGVQVLGNLWNAFQQHKMAKEQMSFAREQWDTNLENSTKTYNTALEDRIRSRHFTEGRSSNETDSYLKQNSL